MELWKTTILPTDDAALAGQMLTHLIHEEPYVLLLVMGTGADAQALAERGSRCSGAKGEPWQVVWIRDPNGVKSILDALQNPKDAPTTGALGMVLSLEDSIYEVFTTLPSNLDIITAFVGAAAV